MLRTLGADLVGMSTALEAIAARAAGPGGLRPLAGHQRRRRHHRRGAGRPRRCSPPARPPRPARAVPRASSSGGCRERPVLVTGAAGRIGTGCAAGCPSAGWALRCLDVVPIAETRPGEEHVVADVTDLAAMVDAIAGRVGGRAHGRHRRRVHLAGHQPRQHRGHLRRRSRPPGGPASAAWCWPAATTPPATRPRPAAGLLREADAPPRPDTYYGVAKVAMEALGSLYVDRYGMDVVCLRIGSAFAEPTTTRHLSTWLSPDDTVSLVDAALTAPVPRLRRRLGRLGQHPQLVGPHRRPGAGLRAAGRRRGLRRGAGRGARRARPRRPGARAGRRRVHAARVRRRALRGRERRDVSADLLAAARAWAADDPHEGDRAEIEALVARRRRRRAGPPVRRSADLRHGGAARTAARRPGRDERRRGHPRRGRAGPPPARRRARRRRRGHRLRRPPPVRRVRARSRPRCWPAPASPSRCCPGRCPRRCSPSPSGTWAASPA